MTKRASFDGTGSPLIHPKRGAIVLEANDVPRRHGVCFLRCPVFITHDLIGTGPDPMRVQPRIDPFKQRIIMYSMSTDTSSFIQTNHGVSYPLVGRQRQRQDRLFAELDEDEVPKIQEQDKVPSAGTPSKSWTDMVNTDSSVHPEGE